MSKQAIRPRLKIRKAARASDEQRRAQAQYVESLVRARFKGSHDEALYPVVGDLNDTPGSPWLEPLVGSSLLTDIVAAHLPADEQWTYYWRARGRVQRLDYILASKALAARIKKCHIERAGLAYRALDRQREVLPKQVTLVPRDAKIDFRFRRYDEVIENVSSNISDHCPVKIWF